ncbi:hypothetical protein DMB42_08085 [Nonomuraea sp. WAC 01424]|uniref:hypothetical protein n=1 Tax=Nonomuraea sp. WAC 01424 TaxID=2203200 RepID=UPI000F7B55A4|nr:hypothetical protein [Nonomuraea sp. WAC 01424]RSN14455.1 hypothetical protein DMB42_08085 [Nonomuraea sp. WAC 01424]
MKRAVSCAAILALAATGCTNIGFDTGQHLPQNDGANADLKGVVHVRNAYLQAAPGQATSPTSPASEQTLYAVVINDGDKPDQLQHITVEGGGGTVQLSGAAADIRPDQPVGANQQPLGTVTGVRGTSVPMIFTFRDAGAVRVIVPVKSNTSQSPAGSAGPTTMTTPAAPGHAPRHSPAH